MPLADLNQGRAKAWWTFNGTGTIAVRDAFNVASLTDIGTGSYTINTSISMLNINFSIFTTGDSTTATSLLAYSRAGLANRTSNAITIGNLNSSITSVDGDYCQGGVLGD